MPIITGIKQQVKRKDRVSLFLDGEYWCSFSLDQFATLRLKKGAEVTPAEAVRLRKLSEEGKALERALRLLTRRAHSAAEIERKLRKKDVPEEIAASVVKDLRARGLLNDKAFADTYVRYRSRQKPRSVRALREELRRRGVESGIIQQAIAPYEGESVQLQAARQALRTKLRSLSREKDPVRKQRLLYGFLSRQGFDFSLIRKAIAQAMGEGENDGEL